MKKTLLSLACLLGSLFTNAQSGAALNFDGGNDYIDIGTVIPLNSSYTKEAWIYANASGSNNIISSSSSPFWIMGGKLSAMHNGGSIFQDPGAFPLNQWVHVAVTYNSSTSLLSLFKNGILVNSGITTTGYPADAIGIGQYGTNGANFFQGSIDEVRLWNVARTQCEIISYMNCEIPGSATGLLANYHFNQGIIAVNNSTVNTLTDASGNSNDGTLSNFALAGAASNWVAPGGVTSGSITPSSCTLAAALDFDGANDYVTVPSGVNIANQSFTIEFWAKRNGTGNGDFLFGQQSSQTTNNSLHIGFRNNDAFTFAFYGNDLDVNHPATTDGNMHHWACVYNSGQTGIDRFIYLDGVLIASDDASGDFSGNGPFNIGNNFFSGDFFNGTMDEVRIWNVARTQCQINTFKDSEIPTTGNGLVANYHFNQGVIPNSNSTVTTLNDASGNFNNGTLNNFTLSGSTSNWIAPGAVVSGFTTTSTSTFCPPAEALNLDGVDDYVDLGIPANLPVGNSAYTIEAKIKPNVLGVEGIVGWGNYGNSGESNALRLDPSGNIINYWWGPDLIVSASPINLLDGNWHHIAATFDGTTRSIFVDGILKGSDMPGASHSVTAQNVRIGSTCTNCGGEFFNGGIDEVRIWNVGRTQCDVISYMNCEIPSTATGLVANYHFNQGLDGTNNATVTTLTDASGNSNNGTLTNFALTGATSNWIAPGGVISGNVTPAVCNLAATLDFDGSDDFIEIGNVIPSGSSYTKEMWVYALDNSCNNLLSSGDDPFYLSSGRLAAGNNGNYNYVQDAANFPLNTWVHAAVTYDALTSTMILYVNGILVASGNSAGPYSGAPTTYIGRHTGGCFFSGKLDEVRVWNVARTQCEINTYMNSEIPSTSTGLLANYHFNQGVDAFDNSIVTSLIDLSGNSNNAMLSNFALNGTTSNWIAPGAVISGFTTTTITSPTISVNSAAICAGQTFTMVPGGAVTYTFSSGSDVVTPTTDATYSVSGTDANGCVSATDAVSSVTVNALPTISVNSGAICAGQSFTIVPSGATTYTYSNGSDIVTPTADATYSVSGTDANGCVSSIDAISSVTVNALPTIAVNSGSICAGQSFTMVPAGATTYTYSNGSSVATPTADATYSVSGTDANGCMSNVDAISSVTVNALPTIMAMTSNTLLCTGETATLSVTGASSYTWSTNENTTNIAVTPTMATTYTVDGIDANGCVNTTTILQDVNACTGIVSLNGNTTSINVYPNPNTGLFIIDLNTTSQVSITNALGQVILTETMEAGKQNLDIQNQSTGIYFVKVIQQDKQHIIKLIKK